MILLLFNMIVVPLLVKRQVVAYHEIGHAFLAVMQSHSAPVQKITIIPRTSGTLGYLP